MWTLAADCKRRATHCTALGTPPTYKSPPITIMYPPIAATRFSISWCLPTLSRALTVCAVGFGFAVSSAHAACGFNIDRLTINDPSLASGEFTSDGLLIVRSLQNLTGSALIAGTRVDQTPANQASVVATIQSHMSTYRAAHDMDGNGFTDINDGLVIARYLAGYRGVSLTQGLTLTGARTTGASIESYIAGGCVTPSIPLTCTLSGVSSLNIGQSGTVNAACTASGTAVTGVTFNWTPSVNLTLGSNCIASSTACTVTANNGGSGSVNVIATKAGYTGSSVAWPITVAGVNNAAPQAGALANVTTTNGGRAVVGVAYTLRLPVTDATGTVNAAVSGLPGATATCSSGNPSNCDVVWTPPAASLYAATITTTDSSGAQSTTRTTIAVQQSPAADDVSVTPDVAGGILETALIGKVAGNFSVSEGGSAGYSIPIQVPPGTNGLQPSLSLNYTSGGSYGSMGIGWSLSGLGAIARCPKTIAQDAIRVPINYDNQENNDAYCLGGQRLIPVTDLISAGNATLNYAAFPSQTIAAYKQEFRTEIDSYVRIIGYKEWPQFTGGPTPNLPRTTGFSRFTVETKDSRIMSYSRRFKPLSNGFDACADANNPLSCPGGERANRVKIFILDRVEDTAGNRMEIEYHTTRPSNAAESTYVVDWDSVGTVSQGGVGLLDVGGNAAYPPTEILPKRITYSGGHSVLFNYEAQPSVAQMRSFDAGAGEGVTTQRMTSVETYADGVLVKRYALTYDSTGASPTQRSRLAAVAECHGAGSDSCLPATNFAWQGSAISALNVVNAGVPQGAYTAFGNRQWAGDIRGNGRTSLILGDFSGNCSGCLLPELRVCEMSGATSTVAGTLTCTPQFIQTNGINNTGNNTYLADVNGDGKADLVSGDETGGAHAVCLAAADGSGFGATLASASACSTSQLGRTVTGGLLQGDFNGDGRIDILVYRRVADYTAIDAEGNWRHKFDLYLGQANGTFTFSGAHFFPASQKEQQQGSLDQNDLRKRFFVADFNGDGAADVMQYMPGDINALNNRWRTCYARNGVNATDVRFDCPRDLQKVLAGVGVASPAPVPQPNAPIQCTVPASALPTATLQINYANQIYTNSGVTAASSATVLNNGTCSTSSSVSWSYSQGGDGGSQADGSVTNNGTATCTNVITVGMTVSQPTLTASTVNQSITVTRGSGSGATGNLIVSILPLTSTPIQSFTLPTGAFCAQSAPSSVTGPRPPDGTKSEQLILADFNGDGLADLAIPVDTNVKTNGNWQVCLSTGDGGFERFTGVGTRTSTCKTVTGMLYAKGDGVVSGDFDGDGRSDLLAYQESIDGTRGWQIAYARGSASGFAAIADSISFSSVNNLTGPAPNNPDIANNARVLDFNGDGISELTLRIGNGDAIRALSPAAMNGTSAGARQEMITRITDGLGAVTEFDYAPITDDTVYVKTATLSPVTSTTNEVDIRSPMQVVKTVRADNGLNCAQGSSDTCPWHSTRFTYYGLRGSINGRGMLGFSQRDTTETFGSYVGATSRTAYNNSLAEWWLAGSMKQAVKTHPNALEARKRLSDAAMSYHPAKTRAGFTASSALTNATIYEVFAAGSSQSAWDLNGAVLPSQSTTTPSWDSTVTGAGSEGYDQDGNVLRTTATTTLGGQTHTKSSVNTYGLRLVSNPVNSLSRGDYTLGRLTRSAVTHSKSGTAAEGGGSITRTSAFTYYGSPAVATGALDACGAGIGNGINSAPGGYVCDEIVEPDYQSAVDDANLWSSTRHRYDAFGNRVKSLTTFKAPANQGDSTGFTSALTRDSGTTTFDAKGRYPVTVKNALNHSESRGYDARFGVMTDLIGPNSLLTQTQLDAFGRKIRERSFAGNSNSSGTVSDASTYTQWCFATPGAISGSAGIADPLTAIIGAAANCNPGESHRKRTRLSGGGITITFYDKLQREVRVKTQAYLTNAAASSTTANQWVESTMAYDARGRRQSTVKPAGDGTVTTSFLYDDLERVIQDTMLGNNGAPSTATITATTTTAYNGLTTTVTRKKATLGQADPTDRTDQVTIRTVDSQGKPLTITDALNGNTRFVHDAVGNLKSVTAPTAAGQLASGGTGSNNGLTETIMYDIRGRKLYMESAQAGSVFTLYNGLGEIIRTETQRITTVNSYDDLGRMTSRNEREGNGSTAPTFTTNWTYDAGSQCGQRTTGKLCTVTTSRANYTNSFGNTPNGPNTESKNTYDQIGRLERSERAMNLSSPTVQGDPATGPKRFTTTTFYDSNSRAQQMGSAGGVIFRNNFAAWNGSVYNVTDPSTVNSYWQANSRHADGQIKWMNVGGTIGTNASAYQTVKTLDGLGRIDTIKTGNATSGANATNVQNANYDIDSFGNLVARSDLPTGGTGGAAITMTAAETYQYDALNRVTGKNGAANSVATFDALGNILTKAGQAGAYTYFTPAVAGAAVANYRLINYAGRDYAYDGDGNVTSDGTGGRTIAYTPWNLPWRAARGANSLTWDYDDSHARTIEKSTQHGTTFFAGGYELIVPTDSTTLNPKMIERTYIPSPEGVVGTLTRISIGNTTTAETVTNKTEYWHKDHLGSLVATTDQTGAITQRFRFDPWGARECLNALGSITSCSASATSGGATNNGSEERGFTGHEMLDEIGLIHMNGRLYDPEIGRFLQADPIIQEPLNGQNYNRYGYVQNNPLSYTDPTGFSWWTKWRRPIVGLVAAIAVPWAVGELFMANAAVVGDTTFAVAAGEFGPAGLTASGQAVANVAGGLAAGGIQGGNVQSAIVGAFTAGLQFGVGQALGHATPALFSGGSINSLAAQKAFAHAAIGCASAAASGGSCKAGAAAAGFSSIAGGSIPGANNIIGRAVVGAVASKLAGGKAEQGALLAAMEGLYNECGATRMCSDIFSASNSTFTTSNSYSGTYNSFRDAPLDAVYLDVELVAGGAIARGISLAFSAARIAAGRAAYTAEVAEIQVMAENARLAGATPEAVARMAHQLRRDIGIKYKELTNPALLEQIYARNVSTYGDRLGPTIDWLRTQGKSWQQITNSASRTGGKDLGF
jgi:RHS repeat-associated protein